MKGDFWLEGLIDDGRHLQLGQWRAGGGLPKWQQRTRIPSMLASDWLNKSVEDGDWSRKISYFWCLDKLPRSICQPFLQVKEHRIWNNILTTAVSPHCFLFFCCIAVHCTQRQSDYNMQQHFKNWEFALRWWRAGDDYTKPLTFFCFLFFFCLILNSNLETNSTPLHILFLLIFIFTASLSSLFYMPLFCSHSK